MPMPPAARPAGRCHIPAAAESRPRPATSMVRPRMVAQVGRARAAVLPAAARREGRWRLGCSARWVANAVAKALLIAPR